MTVLVLVVLVVVFVTVVAALTVGLAAHLTAPTAFPWRNERGQ